MHIYKEPSTLAGDEMTLLRGQITHDACNITWLTVVFDGSPGGLLQAAYNEGSIRCKGWITYVHEPFYHIFILCVKPFEHVGRCPDFNADSATRHRLDTYSLVYQWHRAHTN